MKTRIMYIEHKSDCADRGPARIGRCRFSETRSSVYYGGTRFETLKGSGISGNYFNVETGDEYWISGCKKNGQDRHWAGSGVVEIDADVREEYWTEIRAQPENKDKRTI
ncbi:MAG: hypothetical protein JKY96_08620 [Phycisphaerales bacterium]|nr:hypothetical protein [Phycisphaerales bacterium]